MTSLTLDGLTDRYAFLDPASGKTQIKRTRARSAIIVIAADPMNRIFVLYAWADRVSTDRIIKQVLQVQEAYAPRLFGCEANAQQSLFADALKLKARDMQRRLPLVPVMQPTKLDKDFRIRAALQSVIADGRLFMQAGQHELRDELLTFPMSPTKDLVDALASAVTMAPTRRTGRQRSSERDALARYLRESGVAASLIERRLAEVAS
jgi:hypothetical protein